MLGSCNQFTTVGQCEVLCWCSLCETTANRRESWGNLCCELPQ